MLDIMQRDEIKKLKVSHYFSDGGPKHFKIRRSLGFALVELPVLLSWDDRPQWHFFEAHHGKSHCDARAAVVKYFLKRLAMRGVASEAAAGIARNIRNAKEQTLSSRNATDLGLFDKQEEYDWLPFDKIRIWHMLQWTGQVRKVTAAGKNRQGRAYVLRCLETSGGSEDAFVEQLAVPKYTFEALQAKEERRVATITKRQKNQVAREMIKQVKTTKAKAILGICEENETKVCTDVKEYRGGTIVAVFYDDKWYVGRVEKVGTQFVGRKQIEEGQKKVAVYIKRIYVRFIDPFERTSATVKQVWIELTDESGNFVDDVRLVTSKRFKKNFK